MAGHTTTPQVPGVGNSVAPQPAPNVPPATPEAEASLAQEWLGFLQNPQVQAGLIQFGINALQPAAPGRGTAAHLAAAVAGGGEAIGRVRAAETAESERGRKAGLEERRVGVKEEKLDVQREGFGVERDIAKADREAKKLLQEGKDVAAGDRLGKQLAAAAGLAKDEQAVSIFQIVTRGLFQAHAAELRLGLPGDKAKPPPTSQEINQFSTRVLRAIAGKPQIAEGEFTDAQVLAELSNRDLNGQAQLFAMLPKSQRDRVLLVWQKRQEEARGEDLQERAKAEQAEGEKKKAPKEKGRAPIGSGLGTTTGPVFGGGA